jgi:hypothetical protein
MDIKQTFLNYTKHTVPYGKETEYLKDILPSYLKMDSIGNYYYVIGDNPSSLFIAHLDTVGGDKEIKVVEEKNGILKSDGTSILGADDKAGVVILLYMIEHKVPGFYLFPIGEEVGCVGTGKLTKLLLSKSKKTGVKIGNKTIKINLPNNNLYKHIRKVISFDRMGYTSIITHQLDQRCCSDTFANGLSKELNKNGFNYKIDDSGVYSDSAEFADIYPECTNISVGYFAQHTNNESQDIEFLESLCKACINVNWENLPIDRDPSDIEFLDNYYNYWGGRGSGKNHDEYENKNRYIFEDDDDELPIDYMKDKEKDVKTFFFIDKKYDHISDVSLFKDKIIGINLSSKRIEKESNIIEDILLKFGIDYDDIFWDGLILIIEHKKLETKMNRNELITYSPELSLDKIEGYKDSVQK